MRSDRSRRVNNRLWRGHAAVGITVSLLMYLSIYFGLFAIFKPFIDVWEKPSRHFPMAHITAIDYEPMLADALSDPDLPRDRIAINLPGFHEDPALSIFHQFSPKIFFNPATGERIQDEGRQTGLAMFLNGMHYARPLKKMGLFAFGLVAAGSLFLIVGGLFLILRIRFKPTGKTLRTWYSLWHRRFLTWTAPLFFLIVLCATVMGLSFDGSGPIAHIVTKGEKSDIRPIIGPVLFPEPMPILPAHEPAAMMPIRDLLTIAGKIDSGIHFQRLTLVNWEDRTARIQIEGYDPGKPFLNGITNRPTIVLEAKSGRLIEHRRIQDRPWSVLLTESVYFIHLLFGVGMATRTLVFLAMAACGAAICLGVMLWLEKKKKPFKGKVPFYHWMDKLSLAVMVGVIPATGGVFNLQWLLPFDLTDRIVWQQGAFFNLWLATLAWSFYRINSLVAAKELMALGGVLFISAPILHFMGTGVGPVAMIRNGMPMILAVDAGLAGFGALLLWAAVKLSAKKGWSGRVPAPWTRKESFE